MDFSISGAVHSCKDIFCTATVFQNRKHQETKQMTKTLQERAKTQTQLLRPGEIKSLSDFQLKWNFKFTYIKIDAQVIMEIR